MVVVDSWMLALGPSVQEHGCRSHSQETGCPCIQATRRSYDGGSCEEMHAMGSHK